MADQHHGNRRMIELVCRAGSLAEFLGVLAEVAGQAKRHYHPTEEMQRWTKETVDANRDLLSQLEGHISVAAGPTTMRADRWQLFLPPLTDDPVPFAPPDPDTMLTREGAAGALTGAGFPIAVGTLSSMASKGGGPPYAKFGRAPLHRWSDLLTWAKTRAGVLPAPAPPTGHLDV